MQLYFVVLSLAVSQPIPASTFCLSSRQQVLSPVNDCRWSEFSWDVEDLSCSLFDTALFIPVSMPFWYRFFHCIYAHASIDLVFLSDVAGTEICERQKGTRIPLECGRPALQLLFHDPVWTSMQRYFVVPSLTVSQPIPASTLRLSSRQQVLSPVNDCRWSEFSWDVGDLSCSLFDTALFIPVSMPFWSRFPYRISAHAGIDLVFI
jgi:hypothetical protein